MDTKQHTKLKSKIKSNIKDLSKLKRIKNNIYISPEDQTIKED